MRNDKRKSKKYFTAKEAARYLHMPLSTFYRLSKKGEIRGIRLGGKWIYRQEDIDYYRRNGSGGKDVNMDCREQACLFPTIPYSFRNNSKPANKRLTPRINTRIKASVVFSLNDSKHHGEIRDLGEGGLRFILPYSNGLIVNDPVVLNFKLDEFGEASVQAKGRVAHISKKGVGIKFRSLDEKSREEIRRYVG